MGAAKWGFFLLLRLLRPAAAVVAAAFLFSTAQGEVEDGGEDCRDDEDGL